MTDQWEKTPNSGTYYHSVATFFANGKVNTLQLAHPSLYTMTYGLDGKGRWTSMSKGTTTIVSGVEYNAANQTTNVAIGPGTDYDGYVYDTNTGRMTNWTFQVNSVDETATLTWNPIGTLKELSIIDGFNSGGTQDCKYGTSAPIAGYDDLNRLVYDDCGSGGWGQSFSYDQYDNLTKSVISGRTGTTWAPGYSSSPSNNHVTGATYDSNGNMTNDGLTNTYTWNEFSKMASVNKSGTNCATSGQCIVYDAFGQMVEMDSGSTSTEFWYTQLGKTANMTGSTGNYMYWPAPGGSTVLWNSNPYYMHMDWLGSARVLSLVSSTPSVWSDRAFAPYGEVYATFGNTGLKPLNFTGDTEDVVAGMYDTPNRELAASNQGRWLSPDPAGSGWNQYAYPTNPNSFVDPSGLFRQFTCGGCFMSWGGGDFGGDGSDFGSTGGLESGCGGDGFCGNGGTALADGTFATLGQLGPNYTGVWGGNGFPGIFICDGVCNTYDPGSDSWLSSAADPVGKTQQGCSGPGIPCRLEGTFFPYGHHNGPSKWTYYYGYTLVDVNGDTVYGATVTELLQDANLPNSVFSEVDTFAESGLGRFTDAVGFGVDPDPTSFYFNQSFVAQLGGINYQLTTRNTMFAIYAGPGNIYVNVRNTVP